MYYIKLTFMHTLLSLKDAIMRLCRVLGKTLERKTQKTNVWIVITTTFLFKSEVCVSY